MADDAVDTYHLSDGSLLDVPTGTDAAAATRLVQQAELGIDKSNMAKAEAQNAPVRGDNGKIYSASNTYPDTAIGGAMAWLDHNAGGNWLNRNIVQTTPGSYVNAAMAPLGRAESNAVSWLYDLPATAFNVIKHKTPLGTAYDAPSLSSAIRSEVGVPELSPDAPFYQRAGETALSAWLSPGVGSDMTANAAQSLWGGALGTGFGDLSKYFGGGEMAQFIASLVGAGTTSPASKVFAKATAPGVRSPEAEKVWTQSQAARPTTPGGNFRGLSGPHPSGVDYSQFTPSSTSLMNPTGQRIAASLGSLPYSGKPIEQAQTQTADFIKAGRDAAAENLAGPGGGLPPGGASPASIGAVLTKGAQEAILALQNRQNANWAQMHGIMGVSPGSPGGSEVPLPDTVTAGINAVANQARGEGPTAATNAKIGEITDVTPGIGHNSSRFGPNPVLPALPSMPWTRTQDWVADLRRSLNQNTPVLPGDIADTLKKIANAERERAAEAAAPGVGGALFRNVNESYAKSMLDQAQLERFAGEPLGTSGAPGTKFTGTPGEATAAGRVTNNLQSPNSPEISAITHPDFPQHARLNAAGQIVSTFGDTGGPGNVSGGFRPERFVNDYRGSQPGVEALTLSGGQGAPAALNTLDQMADVASNYSTPTSRYGVVKSFGTAAAVAKMMEMTARLYENIIPWKASEFLAVPQLGRWYANMLESDAFRRALAKQPQNWGDINASLPVAGSTVQTNPPSPLGWSVTQNPSR